MTVRRAPLSTARGGVTSVVLAAAVLSSSYTLTKVALRDVPPLTVGLLRFAVAALLLAGWLALVRRYPVPDRADRRRLALGGLLGVTAYFAVENLGVHLATPTDAALLVASYPAITALLELLIFRKRTGVSGLCGIALAILGVYLIVGHTPEAGPERRIGDALLIVSGVVWALYNFATRGVAGRYPMPVVLFHQARAGALGFLPLALLEYGSWRLPQHPAATLGSLAALTLLCSVAGLGLYARGLRSLRPTVAVNLLNLVPVFGLVIAFVALAEPVTGPQLVGGLVVIAGVMITTRVDRSGKPHEEPHEEPEQEAGAEQEAEHERERKGTVEHR